MKLWVVSRSQTERLLSATRPQRQRQRRLQRWQHQQQLTSPGFLQCNKRRTVRPYFFSQVTQRRKNHPKEQAPIKAVYFLVVARVETGFSLIYLWQLSCRWRFNVLQHKTMFWFIWSDLRLRFSVSPTRSVTSWANVAGQKMKYQVSILPVNSSKMKNFQLLAILSFFYYFLEENTSTGWNLVWGNCLVVSPLARRHWSRSVCSSLTVLATNYTETTTAATTTTTTTKTHKQFVVVVTPTSRLTTPTFKFYGQS